MRGGALILLGASAALIPARVPAKPLAAKRGSAAAQSPGTTGPVTLNLRAVDLRHRIALVEVGGLKRAPQPNFFTFTDERGRHYVAFAARCEEPFPSGTRLCELELPEGYERHRLVALELHLHGLHGKAVAASEAAVTAAWATAEAEQAGEPPTVSPPTAPSTRSRPDGAAPTDAGA
jgi:hypothetical protein